MPKIINVPIEPLEERYSDQWGRWFPRELQKLGVEHVHLNWVTPLSNTIREGSFLDIIGTNYYKASQLQQLMVMFDQGQIHNNDVILFHDGWFPGLEMLAYIRDGLKSINFKIAGIFHAGTYDPWDFLTQQGMASWGRELENSWFKIYDYIFTNSHYQKQLLLSTRVIDERKIFVSGYPFYDEFSSGSTSGKENIVVFPHRLNPEKQPNLFDAVAKNLQKEFPDWQFIKSKDVCKTKQEYYDLLNRSKIAVSCALQETFGIAMVESVMCDCLPLVPNRLSYKELYNPIFSYNNDTDLPKMLNRAIRLCNTGNRDIPRLVQDQRLYFVRNGAVTIGRIANICLGKDPEINQWPIWR